MLTQTETHVVDGLEVVALTDAVGSFMSFREAFASATPEEELAARTSFPQLFRDAEWVLPFRVFVIRSGGETVVVDAGLGPPGGGFVPERQGWLPARLREIDVSPTDVGTVFFTHLHVDHVGWAIDSGGEPMFPRARYLATATDWELRRERDEPGGVFERRLRPLEDGGVVELLPSAEHELAPGVVAFATPGHTPAHMSVRVRDTLVILGDVAVHPLQVPNPELAFAYDEEPDTAATTRVSLLEDLVRTEAVVASPHFPHAFGCVESDVETRWRPLEHA